MHLHSSRKKSPQKNNNKKKPKQVCRGCWKANADSLPTYTKSISQSSDLKVMCRGACYFKAIVFFILEE